ncbi:hypothetical protein LPJ53_001327 [Coemansia erecta]|uniref:SART-1 protein n=1 Tax=Coemansia erecta TaxID=147472 RepID=A0A9W7Y5Z0_9FUNG|nr:hypothetical protein LPJ53_001327 [Coemansia erecta]
MSSTSASEKQGAKRKKVVRPAGQAFDDDAGSDEDLDALRWIERTRRRQQMSLEKAKATARTRKQQPSAQAKKYSADDLKGVRIAHNLTDFAALHATSEDGAGDEHVLVLQDKSISEMDHGDDDDDDNNGGNVIELESVALAEADRARRNADMRSQKLRQAGVAVTADLDSEKAEGKAFFTIESGGVIDESQVDQDERDLRRERGQIHVVIDDDGNLGPSSAVSGAYADPEPTAAFRKPRKIKKSKKKDKKSSTNDFAEIVDVDRVNSLLTRENIVDDSQFAGDDDDLQAAISKVRKSEARKRRKVELDPEELARQISDEVQATMDVDQQPSTEGDSDLVLSSTIEFVQALKNSKALTAAASSTPAKPQPEADDKGSDEDNTTIVRGARPHASGPETGDDTAASGRRGLAASSSDNKPVVDPLTVDQPEQTIGNGLGAALSLLRQRNMIDKLTDEQKKREQEQRSREQWIAEQRRKDAELQRERQRIKQMGRQPVVEAQPAKGRRGKADVLTQKELDEMKAHEQEQLDRKWAREYEERMKDYKPEVKLEYVDETGRQLSTKEAYKQLSHAFHGHYSGKNKIDRLNRQRDRERRQLEHGSSATTHEQAAALENAHRKMGAAGIDLSQIAKPKQQQ